MKAEKNSSPALTILFVAAVAALASIFSWFSSVDTAYYDFLLQKNLLEYPDDVVVIAVDETSIERLGAWPWDRRYHAHLLEKLELADAVVFDFIFAESQSSVLSVSESVDNNIEDAASLSSDKQFAQAISANQKVLLPVYIEQVQYRGELYEVLPLPSLANAAAKLGHAHVDYSSNGIARGIYLREGLGSAYWPHLSLALLDMLGEMPAELAGERGEVESPSSPYTIYRDYFNLLRFVGPPNTIYRLSYVDVLDNLVDPEQWRGKRVFVGATAKGLGDEIPTPVGALPGVEFHANAYQAARLNGFTSHPSPVFHAVFSAACVLILALALSRLTPVQFLITTFVTAIAIALFTYIGLIFADYWFSPIAILLAVILFYPLWSWRRIEIALFFLQQELAVLRKDSNNNDFSLDALKANLSGLAEIGVIDDWQLEVGESLSTKLWPESDYSNSKTKTSFQLDSKAHQLSLQSTLSQEQLSPVISALLSQAVLPDSAPSDSYELVEKTIREIYSIKDVAEKAQVRMNKSMAELQDAVLVADAAGKIIFTNENFRSVFADSFIDRSLVDLQDAIGGYVWIGIVRTIMLEHERVYQEIQLRGDRALLCQAAIINDRENTQDILVFVFTDVTELRYLERGKNEALAFLSHDMRSPIVSLLSLIETYRINHPEMQADKREFIGQLEYFARTNLKYSEDFLQLSRAENVDREVFQLVDMHGIVDGAYAQIHGYAKNKHVDVVIERTQDDCWISGDVQLLERAVTNILYNAVQHTDSGKRVTMSLNAEQGVQVLVKDQGAGIPEELIPHLFEPYFRARDKRLQVLKQSNVPEAVQPNQGAKSYGLGLSFVHTVVKRHGGSISVESEIGKSSSFTLKFPSIAVE